METDALFEKLFPKHVEAVKSNTTPLPTDFDCYRSLVETFRSECAEITDYSMKYMKYFVAECEGMKNFPVGVNMTIDRMTETCAKK